MTTGRQIQRVLKPLAARRADLFLVSPWLILKPVRHVVRGVLLDRTSSANWFRPQWAAVNLCEPMERIPLNWGRRIPRAPQRLWDWDDPEMTEALYRAIEEEAIPELERLETLEGFVAHANSDAFQYNKIRAFLIRQAKVAAALGDVDQARSVCADLAGGRTMWNSPDYADEVRLVVDELYPLLLDNDVAAVAALLRSWEAGSARNLGIEAIWEQTPFPLETRQGTGRP